MRLLEFFTLLELRDRVSYVVDTYGKKIANQLRRDYESNMNIPRAIREVTDNLPLHTQTFFDPDEPESKDPIPSEVVTKIAETVANYLAQYDPTPNNKYLDWIARQYINRHLWLEDAYKMENLLSDFEDYKKNLTPEKLLDAGTKPDFIEKYKNKNLKDINTWKDYRLLAPTLRLLKDKGGPTGVRVQNFVKKDDVQAMMKHPVPDPQIVFGQEDGAPFHDIEVLTRSVEGFDTHDWYETELAGSYKGNPEDDPNVTTEIEPIYISDRLAVLVPNTQRAACELGRGTEWCTASSESENYFWEYAPKDELYVIVTDKLGKFQFHFPTDQFANVHDEILSDEDKKTLVDTYPELRKIFEKQAINTGHLWLMDPKEWTPEKVQDFRDKWGRKATESVLFQMPREWDGEAPEETLSYIEGLIRQEAPAKAWNLLRKPEAQDFVNAMKPIAGSDTPGWGGVLLVRRAENLGIELPDEFWEAVIKRNGYLIFSAPVDRILANPDWVILALRDDPQVLSQALGMLEGKELSRAITTALAKPDTSETEPWTPKKAADYSGAILQSLQRYPKGIETLMAVVKQRPGLATRLGTSFGIAPWVAAFSVGLPRNVRDNLNITLKEMAQKNVDFDFDGLARELIGLAMFNPSTFAAIKDKLSPPVRAMAEIHLGIEPD